MTAPIPQTIASKIQQELAAFVTTAPNYLDPTDPRVVAWGDELEKGMAVARSETFSAQATLAHLCGDLDHALRLAERAFAAGKSADDWRGQRLAILVNLGHAARAAEVAQEYLNLKPPFTMRSPAILAAAGAFGVLGHIIDHMEQQGMHQALERLPQIDSLRQITAGAKASGISDAQYAAVLDVAGAVLRERRLFWLNEEPVLFFDAEMQCAGVRYHVACSPEAARTLDEDFLDRLLAADLDQVPLSVGFIGQDAATAVAA